MIIQWGFDLTQFEPSTWAELLKKFKIKGGNVETRDETVMFTWQGPNFEIFTSNNPTTGEYSIKGRRKNERGYAGYIGIEGDCEAVIKLVNFIKENAEFIKGESSLERSFI